MKLLCLQGLSPPFSTVGNVGGCTRNMCIPIFLKSFISTRANHTLVLPHIKDYKPWRPQMYHNSWYNIVSTYAHNRTYSFISSCAACCGLWTCVVIPAIWGDGIELDHSLPSSALSKQIQRVQITKFTFIWFNFINYVATSYCQRLIKLLSPCYRWC